MDEAIFLHFHQKQNKASSQSPRVFKTLFYLPNKVASFLCNLFDLTGADSHYPFL